jgi:FMN reductase (NADPH)/FMN reductase [NAD(P)H]
VADLHLPFLFNSRTIKKKHKRGTMNQVIDVLMKRRSVRAYQEKVIRPEIRAEILKATFRAPTAGNMMLYSILEVTDQKIKDRLAITCDNQPFIARAPMVWLFLADYQRWFDYFVASGVEELCKEKRVPLRKPEEGDLFLACCDALIAAQNAVIAAESFGVGSCYIGDIMEQYEIHKELFNLPKYTFPIGMLVFGYPAQEQMNRPYTSRFHEKFMLFENQYHRLEQAELKEMFAEREHQMSKGKPQAGIINLGQAMYFRKFSSEFSVEMSRSVRLILKEWLS